MEFSNKQLRAYDALPDQELVSLLKNNDRQAFTEIFHRYHASIYFNIFKIIKNKEEAEDLLQSCFETLWDMRLTLDEKKPVNGWLFKMSYFRSIDILRLKTKEKKDQAAYTQYIDNEKFDEDRSVTEQQLQNLQNVIDRLPPQKRKVVEMCKLQQKSYEKTALELGISKYTVGEYLKEAMAFLRKETLSKESSEIKII